MAIDLLISCCSDSRITFLSWTVSVWDRVINHHFGQKQHRALFWFFFFGKTEPRIGSFKNSHNSFWLKTWRKTKSLQLFSIVSFRNRIMNLKAPYFSWSFLRRNRSFLTFSFSVRTEPGSHLLVFVLGSSLQKEKLFSRKRVNYFMYVPVLWAKFVAISPSIFFSIVWRINFVGCK